MRASHHATITLDRAVEAGQVVRRLREDCGLTQSAIATATGTSVKSVRHWERTSAIRPSNDERLRELREIALVLKETLTPRGVSQWLSARNRILGGRRPVEVMAAGDAKAVLRAAAAYVDGAYV
ncbi:MAG: helix-turn-helix domain-containing protein [Candidatus Binataceae bacterium]